MRVAVLDAVGDITLGPEMTPFPTNFHAEPSHFNSVWWCTGTSRLIVMGNGWSNNTSSRAMLGVVCSVNTGNNTITAGTAAANPDSSGSTYINNTGYESNTAVSVALGTGMITYYKSNSATNAIARGFATNATTFTWGNTVALTDSGGALGNGPLCWVGHYITGEKFITIATAAASQRGPSFRVHTVNSSGNLTTGSVYSPGYNTNNNAANVSRWFLGWKSYSVLAGSNGQPYVVEMLKHPTADSSKIMLYCSNQYASTGGDTYGLSTLTISGTTISDLRNTSGGQSDGGRANFIGRYNYTNWFQGSSAQEYLMMQVNGNSMTERKILFNNTSGFPNVTSLSTTASSAMFGTGTSITGYSLGNSAFVGYNGSGNYVVQSTAGASDPTYAQNSKVVYSWVGSAKSGSQGVVIGVNDGGAISNGNAVNAALTGSLVTGFSGLTPGIRITDINTGQEIGRAMSATTVYVSQLNGGVQ